MGDEITIYFMRHGRSRADDEGVHEGRYDSPLTDVGRSQVQSCAEYLKEQGVQFDCIISSTLKRASESAKIVGDLLDVPIETGDDWMEMDNRPLAGLPFDVAEARYPKPAFRNPYEPFLGVGESDTDVHCRAALALKNIIRRGPGCYLVISHGGFLNAVMRNVVGTGAPINGVHGIWFSFGDAGYVRCEYRPQKHQWIIRELRPGQV